MGKLLVSARGEKKSIKSDNYPEESQSYSDNQGHIDIDGAEIQNGEGDKDDAKDMFSETHQNSDEFDLTPKLEVLLLLFPLAIYLKIGIYGICCLMIGLLP